GGGGGGGGGGDDELTLEPPATGFQLRTPDMTLAPGEEKTFCYYTTLPSEAAGGVHLWESAMTPGSHHMIVYLLDSLPEPDGTVDESGNCGFLAGDLSPRWVYASQDPESNTPLPDGVGISVATRQPVVMQMHYLNASDQPLDTHVLLNGHTYESGVEYQEAHAYITYNDQININPGQEGAVQGSCPLPADAKFFILSTHTHQFSTQVQVTDGGSMVLETDDWEHPGFRLWEDAPYYSFGGNLGYRCEYFNTSDTVVHDGESAATDEMCMVVGYFIGGGGDAACLNNLAVAL
ncbi:MAG TPA: hypothetical protein VMZ28_24920, partial [Kofleriaceae bacterium]|nr:hypothetical protein [Kofleriaceae bacterium]